MRGYFLVFSAASLWGSLGLWFTLLGDRGLSALTIGFLRASICGLLLLAFVLLRDPGALRVPRRMLPFYAAYGLIGVAAFYTLYVESVLLTNVPTASVLLYTAPAWVTLFAWRVWGERLDRAKGIALGLAFLGVLLVARLNDPGQLNLNPGGILIALGSGVTYAIYTIMNKYAVRRQTPAAAVTYSLLFGALFLFLFQWVPLPGRPELAGLRLAALGSGWPVWAPLIALCLGPTLGSYLLYGEGLREVPASNASLVAMIEPVVAAILAWLFLRETLEPVQLLGAALVLTAAGILALTREAK